MNRLVIALAAAASGVLAAGVVSMAQAQPRTSHEARSPQPASEGAGFPDVSVCMLPGMRSWGGAEGKTAFSIATTSINLGTVNLTWLDNCLDDPLDQTCPEAKLHPVIAMNLYRLADGAFEQIGMSWVKHGFCALQQTQCSQCDNQDIFSCVDFLLPNCSDPYSVSTNAAQNRLGPRSAVNPTTGEFPFPHATPTGNDTLRGRLIADDADLDPAQNPGARYFIEGLYIHPEDAQAGIHPVDGVPIDNNNAGWREVLMDGFPFTFENIPTFGSTAAGEPAIFAWQQFNPGTIIDRVEAPDDGHYAVGSYAEETPDGAWRYEYAVYNMTSNRAAGSFTVPVDATAAVSSMGFNDIHHHSGEPFDTTDWAVTEGGTSVNWSTASATENINANALRWGTLYNFRFTSDSAPVLGDANVGLFLPGTPDSVTATVFAPGPNPCAGDLNNDDVIDGADLGVMLLAWGDAGGASDLNGDNVVDGADLGVLLLNWGACG